MKLATIALAVVAVFLTAAAVSVFYFALTIDWRSVLDLVLIYAVWDRDARLRSIINQALGGGKPEPEKPSFIQSIFQSIKKHE